MMQFIEPQRGINTVVRLHQAMISSNTRIYLTPTLADIFVFTYPIYLAALYISWRIQKSIKNKVAALYIFTNVAITTLFNIFIQFFVDKSRPNIVLELADQKMETVLHKYLPTSSFPSDHAAVSMSIAIASIIRWLHKKDKKFLWFGGILITFSLIMGVCRIATAVHRPTDIIWGILVGIFIPLILSTKNISSKLEKMFTWIAKKV